MIAAICVLAYFVVTLTAALVYLGFERSLAKDEWFAIAMFALCPPLWIAICLIVQAAQRRIRKRKIERMNKQRKEDKQ